MKKKLILFLIFLNLIYFKFNFVNAINDNKIVLKVENEIITRFEIKNKILGSLILANQEINQENINKLKKQAVESLIQHKIKVIELSNYDFKIDEKKIYSYLNNISSNNISGLKKQFLNNNLDFELFMDEIRIQFKWQKLIYQIFSKKIEIDENLIDKKLSEIVKNNLNIEEFRLSEIEISLINQELDKKNISEIKEEIKKEGFETTALKYSISTSSASKGDLGWINANSLSKEIYDTISNLKVGGVTEAIKQQNSIIFLKLVDKRNSKPEKIDIAQLKENLINQKKNELFNLYSRSYISKLKNTSLIEYK